MESSPTPPLHINWLSRRVAMDTETLELLVDGDWYFERRARLALEHFQNAMVDGGEATSQPDAHYKEALWYAQYALQGNLQSVLVRFGSKILKSAF